MRIYSWGGVLCGYYCGDVYIFAESVEQARKIAFDKYAVIGCPDDYEQSSWNEDWFIMRDTEPMEIEITSGLVISHSGCD